MGGAGGEAGDGGLQEQRLCCQRTMMESVGNAFCLRLPRTWVLQTGSRGRADRPGAVPWEENRRCDWLLLNPPLSARGTAGLVSGAGKLRSHGFIEKWQRLHPVVSVRLSRVIAILNPPHPSGWFSAKHCLTNTCIAKGLAQQPAVSVAGNVGCIQRSG